jgi:hypothetical protein
MNRTASPLTLSAKDAAILHAVCRYRFLTSLDVAHLLFKPSYLPYVRGRLSRLSGGRQGQPHAYLYRFRLPTPAGNGDLLCTLGAKGREFVEQELGEPVDWHFQPHKLKFFSYPGVLHHLLLARFLVACRAWCRKRDDFALLEERTSYEIAREPPRVTRAISKDKNITLTVIPDAWIKFALFKNGQHTHDLAVLIELDRGMEHGRKFKEHVRGRIELIRSGAYQRVFGVPGVVVAYLTTGQTPQYRQTRMKTMNAWTREVLGELGLQSWAAIFRFTAVEYEHLYGSVGTLFAEPVWYRPDSPTTPVPLVPS